jgi:uncharacterized protein (TIGR03067 family)
MSTFVLIAGRPSAVDLTTNYQGGAVPLHTKAIYDLQGDTLTYCIVAPDLPRPTRFATAPGDGRTLVVLERAAVSP